MNPAPSALNGSAGIGRPADKPKAPSVSLRATWCSLGAAMTFKWKALLEASKAQIDLDEYDNLELIATRLDHLAALRGMYSSKNGSPDPIGKTDASHEAIGVAFSMLCSESEWALHHQIGLATGNEDAAPTLLDGPDGTPTRDGHDWERVGTHFVRRIGTGSVEQRRRALTNVLYAFFPAGTPMMWPFFELHHGLRALDTGEQIPLLRPRSSTQKAKYSVQQHHLMATCIEEFMVCTDHSQAAARRLLRRYYGHSTRQWRERLYTQPNGLTANEIDSALLLARASAKEVMRSRDDPNNKSLRERAREAEAFYGDEAARADGAAYKVIIGYEDIEDT